MKISRIRIENFRNFREIDIATHDHLVIVGENGAGKSNLLHALRLVLDPTLPDSARLLSVDDFWDGLPRPLSIDDSICVSVELSDFEKNKAQLANLGGFLVDPDKMVARLTYRFRPKEGASTPLTSNDYEFRTLGGLEENDNRLDYETRRRFPLDFTAAMRDAEGDLGRWRSSPLRPLLERAWAQVTPDEKLKLKEAMDEVRSDFKSVDPLSEVENNINASMSETSSIDPLTLGFSPSDVDRMLRSLRFFSDDGARRLSESSLGHTNVLYLTMKLLELKQLAAERTREHTFLAIEEPEAHLHPHLQRQTFRKFLSIRSHLPNNAGTGSGKSPAKTKAGPLDELPASVIVTTHSPHTASVAPLRTLVCLRQRTCSEGEARVRETVAVSTAALSLDPPCVEDLERYLDATRGELLFAKGVLLVEGDADAYIVPRIAEFMGLSLDALGISVCRVGGTYFGSYAQLLLALDTPFAVITDGDPDRTPSGPRRAQILYELLFDEEVPLDTIVDEAATMGIFVGDETLEKDLLAMNTRRAEVLAALETFEEHATLATSSPSDDQVLRAIGRIGKGRFAQRLATRMKPRRARLPKVAAKGRRLLQGPRYIVKAIRYVRDLLAEES